MSQVKLIERFYTYLNELDQSYGRLADLLRQKLIAVNTNNIATLDEIMKEEQVYVLLSRGFEGNIRTHRDSLSLKGETLGEIIAELPEEERARFQQRHRQLKATMDTVKGLNERCQQAIENRLYMIDKAVKKLDKSENTTYKTARSPGPPTDSGPRLFTKSI